MSLKRPADSSPADGESAPKRARPAKPLQGPVPLVYQEDREVLGITLWYPERVDEAKREIIAKGLREGGESRVSWIDFLQSGDYDDNKDFVPKEFAGMTCKDLGVVEVEEFFCFDNSIASDADA